MRHSARILYLIVAIGLSLSGLARAQVYVPSSPNAWFDIRNYGALEGSGNASVSDTAFTNAIAAAAAATISGTTPGAFVYIPPTATDYYCTTAHLVPTNVFFVGTGWSSEIGMAGTCQFHFQLDSGAQNVAFNARSTSANPIVSYSSETYFLHTRFVGSLSNSYVVEPYGYPTSDVQFIGCRFQAAYGSTVTGMTLLKTSAVSELTVNDNQFIDVNAGDSTTAIVDGGTASYPTTKQSFVGNIESGAGLTGTDAFTADVSGNLKYLTVAADAWQSYPSFSNLDSSSTINGLSSGAYTFDSGVSAGGSTAGTIESGGLGSSHANNAGSFTLGGSSASVKCDFGETTAGVMTCNKPLVTTSYLGMAQATWVDTQGCAAGTISVDANYIYVCTATNTVKRAALSSF